MRNKSRSIALALGLCSLVALGYGGFRWLGMRSRPNVLLVTLDTTRADRIGAYGYAKARTPVLDRLAKDGVLFEQALSPAPLTLPVHASLMTGLYPPEHGLRTNGAGSLPRERTTLAHMLSEQGYATAAFVASFVLDKRFGLHQGFDEYDDDLTGAEPTQDSIHRFRDGALVVDAALEWLGRSRSKPYFCWVHLYDPHAPYDAHEADFGDDFRDSPYDGEIAYTDRQLGRLLERIGHDPQTIVVVVGDHGEGLGEHLELQHGYTLYRSTQHVPLIVRGAEGAKAGTRVPGPVSLVDVLPTLTDLLHVEPPEEISGKSFVAALSGKSLPPRACYGLTDDPFLQYGWSPLRSLTNERWKYVRTTKPELYDLQADPQEKNNLAPADPARVAAFEKELRDLEAGMTLREATAVRLSDAERRVLASLGYAGGSSQAAVPDDVTLPDVKDMLPFNLATQTAIELMEAGKLEEAEAAFRKIVAESPPEHVSSRVYLGSVYELLGRSNEAEELYKDVLKLRPEYTNALFHLAGIYAERGQLADALKIYAQCAEIEPDSAQPPYNSGLAAAQQGDFERAERHFEDALQLDPAFPGAWSGLGNVRLRLGRTAEAIEAYEAELKANPRSVEAHSNLGAQLGRQGQLKEAETHLSEAVRLAPQNAELRTNLGVCLGLEKKYDEAAAAFEEAVRLDPALPGARTSLGNMQRKRGNVAEAAAAYRGELGRDPRFVEALVNLGALLGGEKKWKEAIPPLTEAVRLAPQNAEAHFNLAMCLAAEGDPRGAAEHLEAVLKIEPEHPQAAAELGRLRTVPSK